MSPGVRHRISTKVFVCIHQVTVDLVVVARLTVSRRQPWAQRHAGTIATGVRHEHQRIRHLIPDANSHPAVARRAGHMQIEVSGVLLDIESEDELFMVALCVGVDEDGGGGVAAAAVVGLDGE